MSAETPKAPAPATPAVPDPVEHQTAVERIAWAANLAAEACIDAYGTPVVPQGVRR